MHIFQKAFDTLLAKVDRLARKIIFLKKKHLKIFNLGKVGGRGNHFFVFYKKLVLSSLNQLFCYWNVFGEKSTGPKLHHRLKPGYTVLGPEGFGTIITEATDAL